MSNATFGGTVIAFEDGGTIVDRISVSDPDVGEAAFVPQTDTVTPYGTFSLAADGIYTFVVTDDDPKTQSLSFNETAPTTPITVTSVDGTVGQIDFLFIGRNDEPVIVSNGGADAVDVSYAENGTAPVTTIVVQDPDSGGLATTPYLLTGADAHLFQIDQNTGVLSFVVAPDFEGPTDSDGNGIYELSLFVRDEIEANDRQDFRITVTDVADTGGNVPTEGNDRLTGTSGNDVIDSLGGNDVVDGGAGNDVLRGRAGDDDLRGGEGNDRLGGGLGNDTLRGGTGQDQLFGNQGSDVLYGEAGNDRLEGQGDDDVLFGGAGNDELRGGTGSDILNGGLGNDGFVFNTTLRGGDVDVITDFSNTAGNDDFVQLDNRIFTALTMAGTLAADCFTANASGLAEDVNDRIVYDTSNGNLFYDADGSGAGAAVLFASVVEQPSLSAADFIVV